MTIYTSPSTTAIPGLRVELRLNGNRIKPDDGYLGLMQRGDIEIILEVEAGRYHNVFTLDHQGHTQNKAEVSRLPAGYIRNWPLTDKEAMENETESAVYLKRVCIQPYKNLPGTGKYPTNTVNIVINDELYQIGVFCQFNRVFFGIQHVDSIIPDENTVRGTVLSFNPFKGLASVYSGIPGLVHRVFWKNMPGVERLHYCRILPMGAVVTWDEEDLTILDSSMTAYQGEINRLSGVKFSR